MAIWDTPRERVREWLREKLRAFVLGPGAVDRAAMAFGQETETFSPELYGNYIATSNGVYACSTQRAQLLAALPLRFYKGDKLVTSGNLIERFSKVNPFWTFKRLIRMSELALCLWGKNHWFLERGQTGRGPVKEIWWARPDRVRLVPHTEKYIDGFLYRPINATKDIPFEKEEAFWMLYDNPIDEFNGLSPIAAARAAADYATAAMRSNTKLFENGLQMGGFVVPKANTTLTPEQATEIDQVIDRRFKGVDKAHRWATFRFEAEMKSAGFNPKEAEFLGGVNFSLEDIARAFKWPLDMIGGRRTYENVDAAMVAAYGFCLIPEGEFFADEITEKILPLFPGEADSCKFDTSLVEVLQEDRSEIIDQMRKLWDMGVPLNKLLKQFMPQLMEKAAGYPWGNSWWAPFSLAPITGEERPEPTTDPVADDTPPDDTERKARGRRRGIEYNSGDHQRIWRQFVRRTEAQEKKLGKATADLFRRQKESILARLRARSARDAQSVADEPFDRPEWIKRFRTEARPIVGGIVEQAGKDALQDLSLGISFKLTEPAVVRFIESRAQRFAREVNDTTWDMLRESLAEGIKAGEGIPALAERVEQVMGDRIESSGETIARTEVIGASNGGTLEAWRQSEVVEEKTWLAALDDRTRDSHQDAHGQTVKLDDDFKVGNGRGPAPGQIGLAEEDINCRCTMTAVISERLLKVKFSRNGKKELTHA